MADTEAQTEETTEETTETQEQAGATQADPDAWYKALPEDQRKAIDAYHDAKTAAQQKALVSEREANKKERAERRDLEKQLEKTAAKAEGAEQEAAQKMLEQLKAANDRADFYADAANAGVVDSRTAWVAIKEYELYDRKGNPDIEALKDKCPYLFKTTQTATTRTNAGTGTGQPAAVVGDFNTNLRNALKG
jgi:multidrug efflux pump subunit AcrA (membrane-fusion protein)